MFLRYLHLERFGTTSVENIEQGECYVFPKLDGTNASVWCENGMKVVAGSRNRQLSLDNDNAGFYNWVLSEGEAQEKIRNFVLANPDYILYGEWLVPHSLKTYRESAWRNFYVFDVFSRAENRFLHYKEYSPMLIDWSITFIPVMTIVRNGGYEHFHSCLERNTYLIEEGKGVGEGVVVKNYDYKNKFDTYNIAKIVTNQFKELNHQEFGPPIINGDLIEEKIAVEYITKHFVDKVKAKIEVESNGWESKFIPKLLGIVWYDFITEELFEAIKKYKNPSINFRLLNRLSVERVKQLLPEIF